MTTSLRYNICESSLVYLETIVSENSAADEGGVRTPHGHLLEAKVGTIGEVVTLKATHEDLVSTRGCCVFRREIHPDTGWIYMVSKTDK